MRNWLILGGVVALILVAIAWFEPTRVVIGTLRGESFAAGRPASYWRTALVSDDPVVKEAAYKTLHDGGGESVEVLVKLLDTRDGPQAADVRWTAAELLGKIGPPAKSASPTLLKALEDSDSHVRDLAATAIPEVETSADAAVPALQKILTTESGRTASRALSKYRDAASPAIPALIDMLNNKKLDNETRWNAARTLGKIGPAAQTAVPALVDNLKDEAESVREHSAEALGDIGPTAKDSVPALITVLTDEATKVRRDAARSLGQIGPEAQAALPALEKLKDDPEKIVQDAAQRAIELISATAEPNSAKSSPKKEISDD